MAAVAVALSPKSFGGSSSSASVQDKQPQSLPGVYKCPLCHKAFNRLEHQTRHIRTHTGEKPHVCTFAGCAKRFSRSDLLTRHSRIHGKQKSRRGAKQYASCAAPAAASANCVLPERQVTTSSFTRSAPASKVASPNVSPLLVYSACPSSTTTQAAHNKVSTQYVSQTMDINMLAMAASLVERRDQPASSSSSSSSYENCYRHRSHTKHSPDQYSSHPYASDYHSAGNWLPLQYAYSGNNKPRENSEDDYDDQYLHRSAERPRPISQLSTTRGLQLSRAHPRAAIQ